MTKQPNQRERTIIKKAAASRAALEAVGDIKALTLHLGDKAIAIRGQPGTEHAGNWVPLEPGYVVRDDPATGELVVEFNGVRVH